MQGYLYLIHLREFINSNENVYKFGRTSDVYFRCKNYPKGSKVVFCVEVSDQVKAEHELIEMLSTQFEQRTDLGREYFQGDWYSIAQVIFSHVGQFYCSDQQQQSGPIIKDISVAIMEFIELQWSQVSGQTVPSKRLYEQFASWVDEEKGYTLSCKVSHAKFSRDLSRLYNARNKVQRHESILQHMLIFPSEKDANDTIQKSSTTFTVPDLVADNEPVIGCETGYNVQTKDVISCPRCGSTFKNNYLLQRHLQRVIVCHPVIKNTSVDDVLCHLKEQLSNERDYGCKFCEANFTNRSNLYRHQSRCLEKQSIKSIPSTSCHLNDTVLNTFGKESMSHISWSSLRKCLSEKESDANALFEVITMIHFSPEAPNNRNVRLFSKKRCQLEVVGVHGKWEVCDASQCLKQMIKKGCMVFSKLTSGGENTIEEFIDGITNKQNRHFYYISRLIMALLERHKRSEDAFVTIL